MIFLKKKLNVCFMVLLIQGFWMNGATADIARDPSCVVDPSGNIISVWSIFDANNLPLIQSSILPVGGSWSTPYTISYDISTNLYNDKPMLYSNNNGDVLLVWQYLDLNNYNSYVATAILLAGTTTWNTAVVSTGAENVNYDAKGSLNDSGNAAVMWSAVIGSDSQIRVSSTTINSPPVWSSPISLTN